MAKRINRNFAEAFSTVLEETDEWRSEINLRELIEESFFSIEKAREKKASWEQIATVLQTTIGGEIEIKADTVRQYYFDAAEKRAELAKKKKRQKAAKTRTQAASSTNQPVTTIEPNQVSSRAVSVAETTFPTGTSEDAEGSFNLRPRRKREEVPEHG